MSSTKNNTNVTSNIGTQNSKYSKLQYFMWLVAGSEISILKDCPTDYNKHAAIGAAIFMTTFLAFCSGSYTGYYFSDSLLGAIIFGLIWALLIFTIDRGMVVTIKKDKDYDSKNFLQKLLPALPRFVLAILIAFFIAIPLELLIFKENIDMHMFFYKQKQSEEYRKGTKKSLIEKKSDKEKLQSELNKVLSDLEKKEPDDYEDAEYTVLKDSVKIVQNEVYQLQNLYNTKLYEANVAYNQIPKIKKYGEDEWEINKYSREWDIYQQKLAIAKQYEANYKNRYYYLTNLEERKEKRRKEWWDSKIAEKASIDQKIKNTNKKIEEETQISDSLSNAFNQKLNAQKEFVLRYTVLSDLTSFYNKNEKESTQSFNIFFLVWLIRLIFIVIEILPVVTKIYAPFGCYDKKILETEEKLIENFEYIISKKIENENKLKEIQYQAEQDMMQYKINLEKSIYEKILQEAAKAQIAVAQKKIEEFKKKHGIV